MDIVKISLLGVCGVMLGFLLKSTKPEYASFITMAIGLLILGLAVGKVTYLFHTLDKIRESLPIDGNYISTLVKMIGITYIGQFSSSICKDVGKVTYLFHTLDKIRESLPIDGNYISTLVKMIGITYIGQFSSSICKDAGYQAIGSQIELFCKLSVMVLSMPVLLALLETIQEFLV